MTNTKTTATVTTQKIIVHGGIFHADDVLCVAMMRHINPSIKAERLFNVDGLDTDAVVFESDTIVADIGGGRYDHHQVDGAVRSDGRKRAACGLLFEDLKEKLFPTPASADNFEREFILPIEDTDNGYEINPLSVAVSALNPSWDETGSVDDAFAKAVDFLQAILEREIANAESSARAEAGIQEALTASDGKLVVLDKYMPFQGVLEETSAKYVVYPSIRGGYNLQTISVEPGSFQAKTWLPEAWLSKKPEGCTFVHPGKFLASFQTLETALKAARTLG
jgi:uncharacterized UPF0160 family protein